MHNVGLVVGTSALMAECSLFVNHWVYTPILIGCPCSDAMESVSRSRTHPHSSIIVDAISLMATWIKSHQFKKRAALFLCVMYNQHGCTLNTFSSRIVWEKVTGSIPLIIAIVLPLLYVCVRRVSGGGNVVRAAQVSFHGITGLVCGGPLRGGAGPRPGSGGSGPHWAGHEVRGRCWVHPQVSILLGILGGGHK